MLLGLINFKTIRFYWQRRCRCHAALLNGIASHVHDYDDTHLDTIIHPTVYHGGAVGLLFGEATPAQYDDNVVVDSRVVAVREIKTVEVDAGIRADECFIEVRLNRNFNGDVRTVLVKHAVGSLERPMTDVQLTEKFVGQSLPVLGQERTEKASQ